MGTERVPLQVPTVAIWAWLIHSLHPPWFNTREHYLIPCCMAPATLAMATFVVRTWGSRNVSTKYVIERLCFPCWHTVDWSGYAVGGANDVGDGEGDGIGSEDTND